MLVLFIYGAVRYWRGGWAMNPQELLRRLCQFVLEQCAAFLLPGWPLIVARAFKMLVAE